MANSSVLQILENATAASQSGDGVVAQATVNFAGGDALLGFSGSAWTQTVGPISLTVWLDGEPLGGQLSIYANLAAMHMSLGRSWAYAPAVSPGPHEVMVVAGMTTITDQNDRVSLTLLELGDGLEVRTTTDVPCPTTSGGATLSEQRFQLEGDNPFLVSSSGSGWVSQAGFVTLWMIVDGGDAVGNEVYANSAEQHLAAVPADAFWPPIERGEHTIALNSDSSTLTDGGDIAHLSAIEFVDPAAAPALVALDPEIQNLAAEQQTGGDYVIGASTFQCSGGTLLFRVSMSGWTSNANEIIGASIEIDGKPVGNLELFANPATTHLTMPSNDLVVTGVPAGQHSFQIQAGAYTNTDANDRVSVIALEFPQ